MSALDRLGDRVFISDVDEQSVFFVVGDAFKAQNAGSHYRSARRHGLDEHQPKTLLAGVGSAEDVGVLVVAGQLCVRHRTGKDDIVDPAFAHHSIRFAVGDTRADDNEAKVGESPSEGAVRAEQVSEALALLTDSPHKHDVDRVISELARLRTRLCKLRNVDAVRNDRVLVRKILVRIRLRRLRDRDPTVQLLRHQREERLARQIPRVNILAIRVEGAHGGPR